jgi:hypothetical protein
MNLKIKDEKLRNKIIKYRDSFTFTLNPKLFFGERRVNEMENFLKEYEGNYDEFRELFNLGRLFLPLIFENLKDEIGKSLLKDIEKNPEKIFSKFEAGKKHFHAIGQNPDRVELHLPK